MIVKVLVGYLLIFLLFLSGCSGIESPVTVNDQDLFIGNRITIEGKIRSIEWFKSNNPQRTIIYMNDWSNREIECGFNSGLNYLKYHYPEIQTGRLKIVGEIVYTGFYYIKLENCQIIY